MEIHVFLLFSLALGFATLAIVEFKDALAQLGFPDPVATAEKCAAANGVEKGEFEKMAEARKVPEDKKIWCMTACLLEKFGAMLPDGKLNWGLILRLNNILHGGDKGPKLVEICKSKIKQGAERCTLAKDLLDCYFVEGKNIGFFDH